MTDLVGVEYWRLPVGLKERPQWCIAGSDKAPYLAGEGGLYHASPVNGPWMEFETACEYAQKFGLNIGYIITNEDPFTCIDMDVKDIRGVDKNGNAIPKELWTTKESLDFYAGTVALANSYTELSVSGTGLHVWVEGNIGAGRRGKGMEIYSQERFIICTGNPVAKVDYHIINGVALAEVTDSTALPVTNGQALLSILLEDIKVANPFVELEEAGQTLEDHVIWDRAVNADNGVKFSTLCAGDWTRLGFPSQSEADMALMSMFTFYSDSNEQCRRMFRETGLGKRDKAVNNDVYLNRTLTLIRSRQAKEAEGAAHAETLAQNFLAAQRTKVGGAELVEGDGGVDPRVIAQLTQMDQTSVTQREPVPIIYEPPKVDGLPWPPGLVGAIAGFIYQSAPRPVKEVAIVAALGLLAGVCGKAYNIGQTGLNLYIILIARSAIGKEAMHSGIGHILRSPCGNGLSHFVDYSDYASGPALTKAMQEKTSFVNVSGEWGRKLQRMADDKREGPMQQLRTVMTNLYQKSGAASVMGGIGYSDKDKNVESVNAVAYSMIGETTPGTFYNTLTSTMMEDGFLSRFNIVEYLGDRPAENKNQLTTLPAELSDALGGIAQHCSQIIGNSNAVAVQIDFDADAREIVETFNLECDAKIWEAGAQENIRQIWNRAHLKVIRICGVLAAADNHVKPVVTVTHVNWAMEVVKADAANMLNKVTNGDIGIDDQSRYLKLESLLSEFIKGNVAKGYKINPAMIADGIIPKNYLQKRTAQINCFSQHRLGASSALDNTIRGLIENGTLVEALKPDIIAKYSFHGRAFKVLGLGL